MLYDLIADGRTTLLEPEAAIRALSRLPLVTLVAVKLPLETVSS